MSAWIKLTAHLPSVPEDWSRWVEAFADCGIEGTVQTDSPPTLSAYLPPNDGPDLQSLSAQLESLGAKTTLESVEEVDWAEAWKQFFKPVKIGSRFLVRPSWEEVGELEGRTEIVLDPGQAFGTGDHPTTRMCLVLLETTELSGKRVADIGCGSGILSIGAAKLGAREVVAVDVDPLSIESTLENAQRNSVTVSALPGKGFEPLGEGVFDVVVSNIISAAIIAIAPTAAQRVSAGGSWIVSGIIKDNWPDVERAVARQGFQVTQVIEEGEWIAAKLSR